MNVCEGVNVCFESVVVIVDSVLLFVFFVFFFQIRHFFVSNELHFGVYALVNIAEGEEITLPFDFKFEKWYINMHLKIVGTVL